MIPMKRRQFVTSSLLATATLATAQTQAVNAAPKKAILELRTYEMRFGASAAILENYLKDALIPALNRQGIKAVGVFREVGKSDPVKLRVLIPHLSVESYATAAGALGSDAVYVKASQVYADITPDKAPYTRYTTSLMLAFDALPQVVVPAPEARIFELRTYEGYSEDAVRRKIRMFNVDELPIFYRTKLNPVFFGEVIAGDNMPCLAYMLTFRNMEERDANWKQFIADADWKRISQASEYASTVSNIIRVFLEPTPYSQL